MEGGECFQNTMVALMPVYIPMPPMWPVPPASEEHASPESVPESVPERASSNDSAAASDKDASARTALEKVYEGPKKWHFYAEGLWLRVTVLHPLNEG